MIQHNKTTTLSSPCGPPARLHITASVVLHVRGLTCGRNPDSTPVGIEAVKSGLLYGRRQVHRLADQGIYKVLFDGLAQSGLSEGLRQVHKLADLGTLTLPFHGVAGSGRPAS